ncbi:MAG: Xaa-Pro dipeptidase [Clostridia bacterium]|nr:Xaa-Pro dipeptidase [Clostridia bacterium]
MAFNADLHVHLALPEKELTDGQIKEKLSRFKDAGVTFLRDGGDAYGVSLRAKSIAEELGIDYRTPVFAIYKEGRYGSFLGKSFGTFDEYKALVDEAEASGADFIKLILSGVVDLKSGENDFEPFFTSEEVSSMVGYAHGKGFSVMAHVNGAENIKMALSAGVDTIEHGYFMDEQCADMLASSDVVWVPTIAAVAAFVGNKEYDQAALAKILADHAKMIKKVWYIGGMIGLGTDNADLEKEYEILKAAIDDREFDAHLETALAHVRWKFTK